MGVEGFGQFCRGMKLGRDRTRMPGISRILNGLVEPAGAESVERMRVGSLGRERIEISLSFNRSKLARSAFRLREAQSGRGLESLGVRILWPL